MQEKTLLVWFVVDGSMLFIALYRALHGIRPIQELEASILSMFVCFVDFLYAIVSLVVTPSVRPLHFQIMTQGDY